MKSDKLLEEAISFAIKAHAGQRRKDGITPYIVHPMHVTTILYEHGIRCQYILAAAMLHDVVEDTLISILDIQNVFGWKVREIVEALTKPLGDYRTVKEARIVKMADRISNVSIPFPEDWGKKRRETYIRGGVAISDDGLEDHKALSKTLFDLCNDRLLELDSNG